MNIKTYRNILFDLLNITVDIALILLAIWAAGLLANWLGLPGILDIRLIIAYVVSMIGMLNIYEMYGKLIRNKYEILLSIAISCAFSSILVAIIHEAFAVYFSPVHHLFYVFSAMLIFILIGCWKLAVIKIAKAIEGVPKLLVIESKTVVNSLARKVKYSYATIYEAWYQMIDADAPEEVEAIIRSMQDYSGVFISPNIPDDVRDHLIAKAVSLGKEIYILPNLYNISVMKNEMVQFDDLPALRLKPFELTRAQRTVKRAFDIVISSLGILITSPVMLICALAIKLDSRGPILYKQERLTYKQKHFMIYKFRTMVQDAEKQTGAVLATNDDPRITRTGRILRLLRIDELPQLFNILFGDMSVVGPRPERPVFVEQYLKEIDNYDKRFHTKAALTGLAQVYARYDTSAKDKTLYDLLYIKDYSFWLDIKLILLTLKIIFMREHAEGVKEEPPYEAAARAKSEQERQEALAALEKKADLTADDPAHTE